jgi:hypothetical protein
MKVLTPDREVIDVHLVPVVVLDGVEESFQFRFVQENLAKFGFSNGSCKKISKHMQIAT